MVVLSRLLLISLVISLGLLGGSLLIREKGQKDREKLSPFECGFDPFSKARTPFSLRFFIVIILFLIFDVEIALLLPLAVAVPRACTGGLVGLTLAVTFILLAGLLHEWAQGALKWLS